MLREAMKSWIFECFTLQSLLPAKYGGKCLFRTLNGLILLHLIYIAIKLSSLFTFASSMANLLLSKANSSLIVSAETCSYSLVSSLIPSSSDSQIRIIGVVKNKEPGFLGTCKTMKSIVKALDGVTKQLCNGNEVALSSRGFADVDLE